MGEKSNDNTSPSPLPPVTLRKVTQQLWHDKHPSCFYMLTVVIDWFSVVLRPGGGGGDTILLDSNSWNIDKNFLYNKQNP